MLHTYAMCGIHPHTHTHTHTHTQLKQFETALVKARMQGLSQEVGGDDMTAAEASKASLLMAAKNLEKAGMHACLECTDTCMYVRV
jgi:hypothetical protein